ncbi:MULTISPECIES: Hsp20/alpha crystallin family protein [Bacillus]|uniref:Hsp20/alpha crystallin family protein n=1 Tax=Bacillus TaxID=1386 RepID=UPI0002E60262|nr:MULTISPECIES: Hsp20/alpha crystallin family protein [Bacillus]
MRALSRWNPDKQPMEQFKKEMNDVFQRFFDDSFFPSTSSFFNKADVYTPAMNIEEKDDSYLIDVEVPGVDPKDVDIQLDGNMIVIKGEKHQENETKDENKKMHVIEHSYGSFYRSFALPENADLDSITAENKNGMLYITVPKNKESKTRRIDIKS